MPLPVCNLFICPSGLRCSFAFGYFLSSWSSWCGFLHNPMLGFCSKQSLRGSPCSNIRLPYMSHLGDSQFGNVWSLWCNCEGQTHLSVGQGQRLLPILMNRVADIAIPTNLGNGIPHRFIGLYASITYL